jgi:HK97 family phage major capsid protein
MPFNRFVSYDDAAPLMPEEVNDFLLTRVAETNPILQLSRRLPNMARGQTRLPVLSSLATAYFVQGHTGLKRTTSVDWENRFVEAEEVAVIVPIPENTLADADYDLWEQIVPEIVTAFNVAITEAILYGTNIPASWTTNLGSAGIVAGATAAGHNPSVAAFPDLYDAIMSESVAGAADGAWMVVEADGYGVTGNVAHISMKGRLRGLRDLNGNPIFLQSMNTEGAYDLLSTTTLFPNDGTVDPAQSLMVSGDWSQLVWSLRQDITYKMLTEAVIQDAGGNIIFNLAQQDMVALRAVMRLGVALPNPINRMNINPATRYPFSVLTA